MPFEGYTERFLQSVFFAKFIARRFYADVDFIRNGDEPAGFDDIYDNRFLPPGSEKINGLHFVFFFRQNKELLKSLPKECKKIFISDGSRFKIGTYKSVLCPNKHYFELGKQSDLKRILYLPFACDVPIIKSDVTKKRILFPAFGTSGEDLDFIISAAKIIKRLRSDAEVQILRFDNTCVEMSDSNVHFQRLMAYVSNADFIVDLNKETEFGLMPFLAACAQIPYIVPDLAIYQEEIRTAFGNRITPYEAIDDVSYGIAKCLDNYFREGHIFHKKMMNDFMDEIKKILGSAN
jgi:hypothetical protein